WLIAQPCCGASAMIFSSRRSSVPCMRSGGLLMGTALGYREYQCALGRWTTRKGWRGSEEPKTVDCGPWTGLVRKLLARLDVGTPELDAGRTVHRSFAHDFGEEEVGDLFDLAYLQRRRWIRHGSQFLEVSLLHPVATAVAIRETVERRHSLAGDAALDRHDQFLAIELGDTKVGA